MIRKKPQTYPQGYGQDSGLLQAIVARQKSAEIRAFPFNSHEFP
jgi:hypothetical protein